MLQKITRESNYWHYSRDKFAKRVYKVLTDGPSSALILRGARRSGKTTFIQKDLQPSAQNRGHATVYASFTSDCSPYAVLGKALVDYYGGQRRENSDGLNVGERRVRVNVSLADVSTCFDLGAEAGIGNKERNKVNSYLLTELAKLNRPTFLFLDEFQEVARTTDGPAFLAMLRAILDRNRMGLKIVFTGSSVYGLRKIFADRVAPFFRFAVPVELPDLDDNFLEFMYNRFKSITSRSIKFSVRKNAFEVFNRSSFLYKSWLSELALDPELDPKESIVLHLERTAESLGFGEMWRTLSPQNRAMARLIAESVVSPLSCDGGEHLTKLMSNGPVSAQSRQSMLRTLVTRDIVQRRERGRYEVSDPLLRHYVLNRPKTDYEDLAFVNL